MTKPKLNDQDAEATSNRHGGVPRRPGPQHDGRGPGAHQRGKPRKARRAAGPPKVAPEHARVIASATIEELLAARAWLVARGDGPTAAAAATAVEHARQRAQRIARFSAWQQETERDLAGVGHRAAEVVAAAWAAHDSGPTWTDLGRAMGWRKARCREWAIPLLEQAGWLTTGDEPRSLRPGPKAGGSAMTGFNEV